VRGDDVRIIHNIAGSTFTMTIKSYVLSLTDEERRWMTEVYKLQSKGLPVDHKIVWRELYDELPNFDPKTVDRKLLFNNGESIGILGIVALEQNESFLDKFDGVIKALGKLVIQGSLHDKIDIELVMQESGMSQGDIHLVLICALEIGRFSNSWSKVEGCHLIKSIGIDQNQAVFESYLKYSGIRPLLNRVYGLITEEQNKLSENFMPDGQYPIIRDGAHMVELLEKFYGPWYAYDMLQYHELLRGQLTLEIAQLQLDSINLFIERANSCSYDAVMNHFEQLPFGKKDRDEYIYFRWTHNLYQSSPIWRNALIVERKAFNHISVAEHAGLISVIARYIIYKKQLESFIELEKRKKPKSAGDLTYRGVVLLHHLLEKYGKDTSKKISKTNAEKIARDYNLKSPDELLKKYEELKKEDFTFSGNTNQLRAFYDQYLLIRPILKELNAEALEELNKRISRLEKQHPMLLEK
jgi:hypothetical protein